MDPCEALLIRTQVQLREKMFVVERGGGHALPKVRDGFGDGSDAGFVFRRKKKRAQERTMNALAKSKPGFPHLLAEIFRKLRHSQKSSFQHLVPLLRRGRGQHRRYWGAGHSVFSLGDPAAGV